MANKVIVVVALALIAVTSAAVMRRDAPAPKEPMTPTEVFDSVSKSLSEIGSAVMKNAGIENAEQAEKKLKDAVKQVSGAMGTFVENLQKQTETLKDNQLVKDLRERAKSFEEEIKKNHPQTVAEFENVSKSFQTLASKTQEIAKTEGVTEIRSLTDNLLTAFSSAVTSVFSDVSEAVLPAKKN